MKELSKGAKKFLEKGVIPNYIVYSRKDDIAYCMECRQEFRAKELGKTKPNMECNCPKCGKKSVLKVDAKTRCWYTEHGIGIVPATDYSGNFIIRYYDVYRKFIDSDYHKPVITYRECMRDMFIDGKFITEDRKYDCEDFKKCRIFNGSCYSYYSKTAIGDPVIHVNMNATHVKIYKYGMRELKRIAPHVPVTKLDPIPQVTNDYQWLQIFARNLQDERYRLLLEYTWKSGLTELARQISRRWDTDTNDKARSLVDILKLSKIHYKNLLKIGKKATKDDLKHFQIATKHNIIKDEECGVIRKYLLELHEIDREDFISSFPYTLHKFGKYADKQEKMDMKMYIDYLKVCKEIGLDMKNDAVMFPKHLKEAHDMVVQMMNDIRFEAKLAGYAEKANEQMTAYAKTVEANSKYCYENDSFEIVVPKTTMEIGEEGFKLRHCVAMYVPDIIAGKKTVLFLRKKSEPNVPFYTVEIMDGMVSQCKGYSNRPRIDEVEQFIRKFAKKFGLKMNDKEYFRAIA